MSSISKGKPFSGFGERRIYSLFIQIRMILHGAMHALPNISSKQAYGWNIMLHNFLSDDRARCFIN